MITRIFKLTVAIFAILLLGIIGGLATTVMAEEVTANAILMHTDENGNGIVTCTDKGICTECNLEYGSEANAIIISFKGYSVKEKGDTGLTFGYNVNEKAVKEYEIVNGISLEMGFVLAIKDFVVGSNPLKADGSIAETTQGSIMKIKASSSETSYAGYDFRLSGAWNSQIELDGVAVSIRGLEFYMAGYVFDGTVSYIQKEGATAKEAFAITYNTIAGL